jgi:hypothetical protein
MKETFPRYIVFCAEQTGAVLRFKRKLWGRYIDENGMDQEEARLKLAYVNAELARRVVQMDTIDG